MSGNALIQNRDIVIVGLQPWDTAIGSNCKDIALEFSKHNRVLYVNYPLDRKTLLQKSADKGVQKRMNVMSGHEQSIVFLKDNLWNLYIDEIVESVNWIPIAPIFDHFNKINNKRIAASIQNAIKELGFRNIILFDDNDMIRSFYLKELLEPVTSIYYYRDYILGVDYWKRHGTRLERQLIAKSDLCITNSVYFADHCLKYNPNSYYAGQGCDLEMFSDRTDLMIPNDVADIPGPVIGYVGALQSLRLNLDLLAYIANARPEWSIVLVGPEDNEFLASDLHQRKNVYFIGPKEPEELPYYIHAFDVCLNPQVINEVTMGNYPRKIDEYLAMGKPVVATTTRLMTEVFSQYTYLGTQGEEYVALIEQALREDSPEKQEARKKYASTHTWENHVAEIYKGILKVENEKKYRY